ncbi:hypothetical protein [Streptomyces sp. NPDC048392]|uniref:hypothetical protein n=1 Tax=Streptomyces sp. NPDC048392 TaxID=3365543 RepID=UPI003711D0FC
MHDDTVHHAGRQMAPVVADTWERARPAARLLRVSFEETPPVTTLDQGRDLAYEPRQPLGVKGVGGNGRVGVSAALANAVHHVTGRRIRKLPITIEDLV